MRMRWGLIGGPFGYHGPRYGILYFFILSRTHLLTFHAIGIIFIIDGGQRLSKQRVNLRDVLDPSG
jgi:hypothetical protein